MPEVCMPADANFGGAIRSTITRPPHSGKRSFLCTECHKNFRSREELYVHAEMCLVEAFENEAVSVFSDMPSLHKSPSPPLGPVPSGITAKGDPPSAPPRLDPERTSLPSTSVANSANREFDTAQAVPSSGPSKLARNHGPSTDENRRSVSLASTSERIPSEVGNIRTIEGTGGLKLVVSVEKSAGSFNSDAEDFTYDVGDDPDFDDVDEDVTVPGMSSVSSSMVPNPMGKVIGALANAEDDPFRPKMECPTCGLVLYRHNFSTHYRIHTGEMPFSCHYCTKRFRTTSALKVHVRAHTGEKPYCCPKCNYSCITKRNLDRHIINNHVREGERRGPRQRKSRYRNEIDDEYYGINDFGDEADAETADHHYVVLSENDLEEVEDSGGAAVEALEEIEEVRT